MCIVYLLFSPFCCLIFGMCGFSGLIFENNNLDPDISDPSQTKDSVPNPPLSGRATKKRPLFLCGFPKKPWIRIRPLKGLYLIKISSLLIVITSFINISLKNNVKLELNYTKHNQEKTIVIKEWREEGEGVMMKFKFALGKPQKQIGLFLILFFIYKITTFPPAPKKSFFTCKPVWFCWRTCRQSWWPLWVYRPRSQCPPSPSAPWTAPATQPGVCTRQDEDGTR